MTTHTDLIARLKEAYDRGYADAAEILTGIDRSMT